MTQSPFSEAVEAYERRLNAWQHVLEVVKTLREKLRDLQGYEVTISPMEPDSETDGCVNFLLFMEEIDTFASRFQDITGVSLTPCRGILYEYYGRIENVQIKISVKHKSLWDR